MPTLRDLVLTFFWMWCSVEDLMHEHSDLLTWETVSDEVLHPKSMAFSSTQLAFQQQSQLLGMMPNQNSERASPSGPPSAAA